MPLTEDQIKRAQARLAVVEHLLVNLSSLFELVASGAIIDPEVIAALTQVKDDQRDDVLTLLNNLAAPGSNNPIDQPLAQLGRQRVEQAKVMLAYLMKLAGRILASAETDEQGNTVFDLTPEQKTALQDEVTRVVNALKSLINTL